MNDADMQKKESLRSKLTSLLLTLKKNRENVPLDILKTKYQKGYTALCQDIRLNAEEYAKYAVLHDIHIAKPYVEEGVAIINQTIQASGILKELSKAAFLHQNITEFELHLETLRVKIMDSLEPLYKAHLGLYITKECLENPEVPPLIYCSVNDSVLLQDKWVPLEELSVHRKKSIA